MPAFDPPLHPQHISVHVAASRGANGTGVASLVFGLLACLISWIPVIGLLSWPFAGLAILLAFIGLVVAACDRSSGFGTPIAGLVTGVLAVVLSLASTAGLAWLLGEQAARDAQHTAVPPTLSPGPESSPSIPDPTPTPHPAATPDADVPAPPPTASLDPADRARAERQNEIERRHARARAAASRRASAGLGPRRP